MFAEGRRNVAGEQLLGCSKIKAGFMTLFYLIPQVYHIFIIYHINHKQYNLILFNLISSTLSLPMLMYLLHK